MGLPVRVAILGTGSRGSVYGSFAARYPGQARVVAVADPRTSRRDVFADRHGLRAECRFGDWRELAERPRLADAVVIATPDREHVAPARRFADLGYHVLLEKPLAPSSAECIELVGAMEKAGVVLAVGHVMRYTAYTDAIQQAVTGGRLGEITGIDHVEPVGWWHYAHSYVRGNWRRADQAGPSILTKCCHDLDWLRYIIGRPAVRVSSTGGLRHFTPANRPAGAADRCLDCKIEPDCPFSAVRLYLGCLGDPRREQWPLSVVTTDLTEHGVREALRDGPYGRCVYGCDNDVADHQVTTVEFDGGVAATLTMSAFTPPARRMTRIMGTRGYLDGDGTSATLTDFVTGRSEQLPVPPAADDVPGGHAGGDYGLMSAFVEAIATGDRSAIRSSPRESLESHLMAFAAEESRARGGQPVAMTSC